MPLDHQAQNVNAVFASRSIASFEITSGDARLVHGSFIPIYLGIYSTTTLINFRIAKADPTVSRRVPNRSPGDEITLPAGSTEVNQPQVLPDWDNGSLQPAGIFSSRTSRSGFSLGSILNASEQLSSGTRSEVPSISTDDPVHLGLVNGSIALSLFEE